MSGPQVIEVVVIDSDINDTDDSKGEPDVTINGKVLRMVQAVDGNWYGYFADLTQATTADATTLATVAGAAVGLDFGVFCAADFTSADAANAAKGPVTFGETSGVAVPMAAAVGGCTDAAVPAIGAPVAFTDAANAGAVASQNVVREAKDLSTNTAGDVGQIGVALESWPFIQLYPLNPTGNVVVQYNKGGGVQTTTLTFDTVEGYAGASLDRTSYPPGAAIHATLTDLWLNIDPTDEDSWTWNTVTGDAYYQMFNENGGLEADGVAAVTTTNTVLDAGDKSSLMCEDNCTLLVNANTQGATNPVLQIQDNDDNFVTGGPVATAAATNKLLAGTAPVTVTEQGPNSGVFGTYDESDVSTLLVNPSAARGTSATLDYNETAATVLVGLNFASVEIVVPDDSWNSGETAAVVIVDADLNLNS
jgi:hypothetical protein